MENKTGKKLYPHKPHFCIFCKEDIKRIHEHFRRKHGEEDRIKQILSTKNKRLRFWLWKQLTQEGDNYFNSKSDDSLKERKIVVNKPSSARKKYYTCANCLGRIRTTSRKQHKQKCDYIFKQSDSEKGEQPDLFKGVSESVINRIRIGRHMNPFIQHLNEIKDSRGSIRTVMSDLIELEDSLQEKTKVVKPLTSFLRVSELDNFLIVIKNLCGNCQLNKEKVFRYPFKALRLCRTIKDLIKFLTIHYSKNNVDDEVINLTKFGTIFEAESDKKIKKKALKTIKTRRLKNPKTLPRLTHVNFLINKLKEETPNLIDKLKSEPTAGAWRALAENVLCRLTIYNRRRGGAIERMKIKDYTNTQIRSKVSTEEAIFGLEECDLKYLESIKVVEILHKCDNLVPIIVNSEMQAAMDLLLQYREHANILEGNEYFFAATQNSLNPISGVKVLERYRQLLPENARKTFTATNLRKHGATTTQLLDLSLQDKEEWAHHLGHSVEVHNKYYRNKELVNGILTTGRILTALDEGTLKYYKGKKISEIPLKVTTTPTTNPDNNPPTPDKAQKSPDTSLTVTTVQPTNLDYQPPTPTPIQKSQDAPFTASSQYIQPAIPPFVPGPSDALSTTGSTQITTIQPTTLDYQPQTPPPTQKSPDSSYTITTLQPAKLDYKQPTPTPIHKTPDDSYTITTLQPANLGYKPPKPTPIQKSQDASFSGFSQFIQPAVSPFIPGPSDALSTTGSTQITTLQPTNIDYKSPTPPPIHESPDASYTITTLQPANLDYKQPRPTPIKRRRDASFTGSSQYIQPVIPPFGPGPSDALSTTGSTQITTIQPTYLDYKPQTPPPTQKSPDSSYTITTLEPANLDYKPPTPTPIHKIQDASYTITTLQPANLDYKQPTSTPTNKRRHASFTGSSQYIQPAIPAFPPRPSGAVKTISSTQGSRQYIQPAISPFVPGPSVARYATSSTQITTIHPTYLDYKSPTPPPIQKSQDASYTITTLQSANSGYKPPKPTPIHRGQDASFTGSSQFIQPAVSPFVPGPSGAVETTSTTQITNIHPTNLDYKLPIPPPIQKSPDASYTITTLQPANLDYKQPRSTPIKKRRDASFTSSSQHIQPALSPFLPGPSDALSNTGSTQITTVQPTNLDYQPPTPTPIHKDQDASFRASSQYIQPANWPFVPGPSDALSTTGSTQITTIQPTYLDYKPQTPTPIQKSQDASYTINTLQPANLDYKQPRSTPIKKRRDASFTSSREYIQPAVSPSVPRPPVALNATSSTQSSRQYIQPAISPFVPGPSGAVKTTSSPQSSSQFMQPALSPFVPGPSHASSTTGSTQVTTLQRANLDYKQPIPTPIKKRRDASFTGPSQHTQPAIGTFVPGPSVALKATSSTQSSSQHIQPAISPFVPGPSVALNATGSTQSTTIQRTESDHNPPTTTQTQNSLHPPFTGAGQFISVWVPGLSAPINTISNTQGSSQHIQPAISPFVPGPSVALNATGSTQIPTLQPAKLDYKPPTPTPTMKRRDASFTGSGQYIQPAISSFVPRPSGAVQTISSTQGTTIQSTESDHNPPTTTQTQNSLHPPFTGAGQFISVWVPGLSAPINTISNTQGAGQYISFWLPGSSGPINTNSSTQSSSQYIQPVISSFVPRPSVTLSNTSNTQSSSQHIQPANLPFVPGQSVALNATRSTQIATIQPINIDYKLPSSIPTPIQKREDTSFTGHLADEERNPWMARLKTEGPNL